VPLDRPQAREWTFSPKALAAVEHWLDRLGAPMHDMADLVQEVSLSACKSFDAYDPSRAPPERWLNRIAVHVAAHYRDRARHHREESLSDDIDALLDAPSAEEQLESECVRRLTLEMLDQLEPELRSVLVAHDLDGLSMAEVAERYHVPLSTVYKRRVRAVNALREIAVQRFAEEDGAAFSPPAMSQRSGRKPRRAAERRPVSDRSAGPATRELESRGSDLPGAPWGECESARYPR
jgi:RNA polymerase sigma-70 factor, ECF subfamily